MKVVGRTGCDSCRFNSGGFALLLVEQTEVKVRHERRVDVLAGSVVMDSLLHLRLDIVERVAQLVYNNLDYSFVHLRTDRLLKDMGCSSVSILG